MHNVSLEFTTLSGVINEAFDAEEEGQNDTDLFWDRFSDSCAVSYGDASYTVVSSIIVSQAIEEVKDRIQATDFFDEFDDEDDEGAAQVRAAAFGQRCEKALQLIQAGLEYFDLEN